MFPVEQSLDIGAQQPMLNQTIRMAELDRKLLLGTPKVHQQSYPDIQEVLIFQSYKYNVFFMSIFE
jgi:hypothetical protein